MIKRIKKRAFSMTDNHFKSNDLRRSFISGLFVFLLLINAFSIIFLGGAKQASATYIDVNRLIQLANQERSSRGLSILSVDSRLTSAAQAKGEDMFAKQYWAHYGPNGETPWQFIKAAGYNYIYAGENLAKDFTSTDPIHTAWMNSPTHRDNIINPNYEDIGISAVSGIFDGKQTVIVVQMFGSEYVAPEPTDPTPEPEPTPDPTPQPQPQPTPQPTPSPTPQPTPENPASNDTNKPNRPVITEPINGSILTVPEFSIKGLTDRGTEVAIYDGEERIGTLNSEGGAFDYIYSGVEDGEHVLGATAKDSEGNVSNRSENVVITVDTKSPTVVVDSFKLLYWDENNSRYVFSVRIEGSPASVVAVLGSYSVDFKDMTNGIWEVEFNPDGELLAEAGRSFSIVVTDAAGNKTYAEVSIPILENIDEDLDELPETGERKRGVIGDLIDRFVQYFVHAPFITKVNVIVGFILLVLTVIDVYLLWRKGKIRRGGDSLNHIPILILLLIALLFVATGLIL